MRVSPIVCVVLLAGCGAEPRPEPLRLAPSEALGGAAPDGYARALGPQPLEFPADHGPHPAFRTEWWYVTGNLLTPSGRRFGYQLTIFRNALRPEAVASDSSWRTRDLWFAHFAVTDVEGGVLHGFERFARGALGLAGAHAEPFRAWLEDWELASVGEALSPLRVRAREEGVAIALELRSEKPIVLQGDRGFSPKSAEPGNASFYWSLTRLETTGVVEVGGERFEVAGSSWLDREWSTSALGDDQLGWDWFALQLDDGRDLMFYRMRRDDGSSDATSSGTLVSAEGTVTKLALADVELVETATWTHADGRDYPARWNLRVPAHGLDLEVVPVLADQAHDFVVRYWEGAVDVRGAAGERGVGYVELTGY